MNNRRFELHNILCSILGCPIEGDECRCYFQPPENVKMKYPAIVYRLDDIESSFANDGVYLSNRRYSITLMDQNPDSELVAKIAELPMCKFNRHFEKDNLNHDVFLLFY